MAKVIQDKEDVRDKGMDEAQESAPSTPSSPMRVGIKIHQRTNVPTSGKVVSRKIGK